MKTRAFLRDIDDDRHYADCLENTIALLYEELGEVLAKYPLIQTDMFDPKGNVSTADSIATYEQLARMRHTMSLIIRDMADRKKRLRDVAVGLADVELDE